MRGSMLLRMNGRMMEVNMDCLLDASGSIINLSGVSNSIFKVDCSYFSPLNCSLIFFKDYSIV